MASGTPYLSALQLVLGSNSNQNHLDTATPRILSKCGKGTRCLSCGFYLDLEKFQEILLQISSSHLTVQNQDAYEFQTDHGQANVISSGPEEQALLRPGRGVRCL